MKKILILFLFVISCNTNPYAKYDGLWLLEKVEISNINCLKYFHVNSIKFESKKRKGSVPGSIFAERDMNVDLKIIFQSKEMDSILLTTKNQLFDRKFKVTFFKKNNRRYFNMQSDSIYIEGYNAFN